MRETQNCDTKAPTDGQRRPWRPPSQWRSPAPRRRGSAAALQLAAASAQSCGALNETGRRTNKSTRADKRTARPPRRGPQAALRIAGRGEEAARHPVGARLGGAVDVVAQLQKGAWAPGPLRRGRIEAIRQSGDQTRRCEPTRRKEDKQQPDSTVRRPRSPHASLARDQCAALDIVHTSAPPPSPSGRFLIPRSPARRLLSLQMRLRVLTPPLLTSRFSRSLRRAIARRIESPSSSVLPFVLLVPPLGPPASPAAVLLRFPLVATHLSGPLGRSLAPLMPSLCPHPATAVPPLAALETYFSDQAAAAAGSVAPRATGGREELRQLS